MWAVPRSQQIHTSSESSANSENPQSVLDFQALFKMKKLEEKKEHMNGSLLCRLQKSL